MSKIYGADVSTLISVDGWRAIKVGVGRPYQRADRIASRAAQSLAGELSWVDVYHFPNRHVDAAQQVNDTLDAFGMPGVRYNRCWFHVEDSGQWSSDPASNAGFLRRLISAAEARGVPAGIYTSTAAWAKVITNDISLATTPLWYAHWDSDGSRDGILRGYGPTAGWSALAMQPAKGDARRSDDATRLQGNRGAPGPTPPPGTVLDAVDSSAGIYGADVSTLVSPDGWRALHTNHSASFGIVRCYQSNGQVDPNAAQSLKNAATAGLSWVDVYHFPSGNVDPTQQVNDALNALSSAGASFNRYWFDVESQGPWSGNSTNNAAILRQLIAAAEARKVRVGIYTAVSEWSKIMANDTSFAAYPLWYAHYDGNPGFSDFKTYGPNGGWAAPAMKQFKGDERCSYGNQQSVSYDGNYCPGDSAAVPTSAPPPTSTSEPPPASTSEPPPPQNAGGGSTVPGAGDSSASIYGADLSTLVSPDGWRALKTNRSASFGIVRCYQSIGQVDPNAAQSLKNAATAGLPWVDVYHFPSGKIDPTQQVNDALNALSRAGASFNRYWFDVQDGGPWSSSPANNATILRQFIAAAEAKSVRVGIYTSYAMWSKIMANDISFASYPLWYAHWDGNASFSDFKTHGPNGGWAAPAMKQFRANECCSYGNQQSVWYDGNYCPGDSAAVPTSAPPPTSTSEPPPASTSEPPPASTSEPPPASTSEPPPASTSEPPPASTSKPPPAPDTTDIRTRIVNFAQSVVNLDANPKNPLSRAEYLSLIAPAETPSAESSMATMSGCGLTVASIWRACGLYDASLNAPYKSTSAISRLKQIADKVGAWVPYSASTAPAPGDMVLLENTEHVYTVIQINSTTGGYALKSVDGGQTDTSHYQTILQVSRTWSGGHDTNPYSTRPIIGWVNVQKLPFASAPPVVGFVQSAPAAQKGFEAQQPLDVSTIRSLAGQGYRFCVRTLALKEGVGADDLSYAEAQAILSAGLGLMAIQRTSPGSGVPSASLGQQRGQIAAANAKAAGLPMCVTLWLYLAGISSTTTAQAVVDYCNSWYTAVYNAGFTPGLCVGENPGLDSSALHAKLSFKHYWRTIGKSIPNVQTRGYQMLESMPSTANEIVTGDLTTQNDSQGDCVQWLIAAPIVQR